MNTKKSFCFEDSVFSPSDPERELLHVSFGMDAENCLLVSAGVIAGVIIVVKLASCIRKASRRSHEKRLLRMKQKLKQAK